MTGFQNHQATDAHAARLEPAGAENARHYVVTGQHQWTDEEFYESGRIQIEEEVLNDLPNVSRDGIRSR